jgi:multidrug efflux pump subunit AcrA (membrane-fusion protein)
VTVYVQIPNPGGEIRGGTFVNGRIVLRTVPDALVIASAALRQSADGGAPTVYRISDQTLDPVTVSTGVANEEAGLVQITKGLREGDMIVVGNVGTLGRGMKVTIIGNEAAAR